jgi:glutathione peroxidase
MRLSRRAFAAAFCCSLAAPALSAGPSAHDFGFTSIEGDPLAMSSYAGKTVLLVNTASRCGFTGQYEGLQALYDTYKDKGLVVLGVPSGDFRQELSSNEAVAEFCEINYGINFPMTEIEPVTGKSAHPLFAWMAEQGSVPRWNFNKFLIGPDGKLIASYGSTTRPDAPKLLAQIDETLSQ